MLDPKKRKENEKKFGEWDEFANGNRSYYFEVNGRQGWKARYVKEVDISEKTIKFYQEIYNQKGILVEKHEKYPIDKGHQKINGDKR